MAEQLDMERRLVGEATSWTLLKEMWTIAGNRKRALISIGLMVCQQITGTNTLVSGPAQSPDVRSVWRANGRLRRTTMRRRYSHTWGSRVQAAASSQRECTAL